MTTSSATHPTKQPTAALKQKQTNFPTDAHPKHKPMSINMIRIAMQDHTEKGFDWDENSCAEGAGFVLRC